MNDHRARYSGGCIARCVCDVIIEQVSACDSGIYRTGHGNVPADVTIARIDGCGTRFSIRGALLNVEWVVAVQCDDGCNDVYLKNENGARDGISCITGRIDNVVGDGRAFRRPRNRCVDDSGIVDYIGCGCDACGDIAILFIGCDYAWFTICIANQ